MPDDGSRPLSGLSDLLNSHRRNRGPLLWFCALAGLVVTLLAWRWLAGDEAEAPLYVTEAIRRGSLTATVTATGTLEPTNQVDVGSELSGTVARVLVDTNDRVSKGQVLAQLDTRKLAEQTERTRATLRAVEARVSQARATLAEADANLRRLTELRAKSGGTLPSEAELDAARATAARARADLDSAIATVAEAAANLRANENDLAKGNIKAPIDGIVLTRTVEPGQTVAASFQAPVLFTLAEDLSRMTLKVDVAEADVGQVKPGQRATFTVDAWPGRRFDASVTKVQFGSKVVENVVSYPTELEVANADLGLRPGMTATADLHVAERRNVLLVPSAALRYAPQSAGGDDRRRGFSLVPQMPQRRKAQRANGTATSGERQIWILRDGAPQPLPVRAGASDGRMTEVSGEGVVVGLEVITEAAGAAP